MKKVARLRFDRLARTYDLGNTLMSFGLDAGWRRKSIALLGLSAGDRVLDVCGGTASLARLAARRAGRAGRAVVCDISPEMIRAGKRRTNISPDAAPVDFILGDAENLGFADGSFDAVTMGFGARSLSSLAASFREAFRVLKPGGRVMILEFGLPPGRVFRTLYRFYSDWIMPWESRLVHGRASAVRFLVKSIRAFPPPEAVIRILGEAGFDGARFVRVTGGIAVIYLGLKPGAAAVPREPSDRRAQAIIREGHAAT